MIGRTLHHYRILETLGSGGMGEIYVAEDTKLNRMVALKILRSKHSPRRLRRFEQEAKAIAALNHPNIVTVYSVEEAEGAHFITMELVKGKTLAVLIPQNGFPFDKFIDLAIALADAVSSAHQRGIIHRDLKPENLMQDEEGRLKILDFGLAKWKQESFSVDVSERRTSSLSRDGHIVGTAAYMSPEQAQGKKIDQRSDIFAMGIILYEMTTGQRPFHGETTLASVASILKDVPTSVTKLNPSLPTILGRIIKRCLVKDPEHRYQTAKDVRNELEELKRDVESGATSPGQQIPSSGAGTHSGEVSRPFGSGERAGPWVKATPWSRRAWVGGAVAALVVSIWVLFLLTGGGPHPVHLEPSGNEVLWGRRILLKWQPPPDDLEPQRFEVEIRQAGRTLSSKANRSQYPFFPIDEGFEDGAFDWRVRATDPKSEWSPRQAVSFYRDRTSRIQTSGVIRVGLFADELPPFAYTARSETDNVDGIEVRVAKILARELAKFPGWPADLRVAFERGEWLLGNIDDLKSGRADIVIADTTGSRERAERHNLLFTLPYFETRLAFVWKGTQSVQDWSELVGKKVGIFPDSTAHFVLEAYGASGRHYRSTSQMYEALNRGEVNVLLDDDYVSRCEARNSRAGEFEVRTFVPPADMALAFAYPEPLAAYVLNDGSSIDLLEQVNRILGRSSIKEEIQVMAKEFLDAPDCKARSSTESSEPDL